MSFRSRIKDHLSLPFSSGRSRSRSRARKPELENSNHEPDYGGAHGSQSQPMGTEPVKQTVAESTQPCRGLEGLWEEAYKQLADQEPELLAEYEKLLISATGKSKPAADENLPPSQRLEQVQSITTEQQKALSENRLHFSVNGKRIVLREQAEKIIDSVMAVKDVVNAAIVTCPPAAVAWAGTVVLFPILSAMFQQDADAMEGFELTADLLTQFRFIETRFDFAVLQSRETATQEMLASIREKTCNLYGQIYSYHVKLAVHYSHSTTSRYLKDLASILATTTWSTMIHSLKATREQITSHFHALDFVQTEDLYLKVDRFSTRESEGVCKTQVDSLRQIKEWCEDDDSKMILWLCGMAGTGKSTIARTVAWALNASKWTDGCNVHEDIHLVGSFFFRQGDQETSDIALLIPTLAWSFVHTMPLVAPYILNAIDKDPDITTKLPSEQWENLILEPLSTVDQSALAAKRYVVVIDSLDECDDHKLIRSLLLLMQKLNNLRHLKMKFLISSRPERKIKNAFSKLSQECHHRQELKKVQPGMSDIRTLLKTDLAAIAEKLRLGPDWPGVDKVEKLHARADGLYVYASTACHFLDDEDYYETRLNILLGEDADDLGDEEYQESSDDDLTEGSRRSPQEKLDRMYAKILRNCLEGRRAPERKDFLVYFKKIVGSVMLLFRPLPADSLGYLLFGSYSDSKRQIDKVFAPLQSVIDSDEGDGVVPVHQSVRDFLLDNSRCRIAPEFWIDMQDTHSELLEKCLATMDHLKQDICKMKAPGFRVAELAPGKVEECLPLHVQYACRHWVDHLAALDDIKPESASLADGGPVHRFMQNKFLFWLEALSVMKHLTLSIHQLNKLQTMINKTENPKLYDFVQDAGRFVLRFRPIIEQSPLQLYCSALVFSSSKCLVRSQYSSLIPPWIKIAHVDSEKRSPECLVIETHDGPISSIACRGGIIASASFDVVHLWDAITGAGKGRIHDVMVKTVALSWDGAMLAILSIQGVRLHTIATGEEMTLGVHETQWKIEGPMTSAVKKKILYNRTMDLAFSPDGGILVLSESSSSTFSIAVWDLRDRHVTKGRPVFNCHYTQWHAKKIAVQDCEHVLVHEVSDSKQQVRRLHWPTGTFGPPLLQCDRYGTDIALAPDGTALAAYDVEGSTHDAVRRFKVWDTAAGVVLWSLSFPLKRLWGDIDQVALSPGGTMIVFLEFPHTALMTPVTEVKLAGFPASYVTTLTFSADSKMLIFGDWDGQLTVWDTNTPDAVPDHSGNVPFGQVRISPDGDTIWNLTRFYRVAETEVQLLRVDKWKKLEFLHDGRIAIVVQNRLQIWSKHMGVRLCEVEGVHDCVFSPDSRLVAYWFYDKLSIRGTGNLERIAEWDVEAFQRLTFSNDGTTGRGLSRCETGPIGSWEGQGCVRFSPTNDLVALRFERDAIGIWDTSPAPSSENERPERPRLVLHTQYGSGNLAFSPDGHYLIVSSKSESAGDTAFEVWDTAQGTKLYTAPVYSRRSYCLAVSVTGLVAALVAFSDSNGKGVILWDLMTGEFRGRLELDDSLYNISFSADGHYITCKRGRLLLLFCTATDPTDPLYVSRHWIRQGSRDLIWLPPDYRDADVVVQEDAVALGQGDGKIHYIRLDLAQTPL
ncbi:WD40-repeat-containing domain protein [Aspergillus egyptiacus]|nr:WD40-repeat-containing domain protein [Aspergillus egyptiacus]